MCVPGTKYTAHSDNHFNFKISIKYNSKKILNKNLRENF
jgi:hypothetical protein